MRYLVRNGHVRKPWNPNRAKKSGGRIGNLLLARECVRLADHPAKTPESRADYLNRVDYYLSRSVSRRAYILRPGHHCYCQECGIRMTASDAIVNRECTTMADLQAFCESCAYRLGLRVWDGATMDTSTLNEYPYYR